MRQDAEDGRLEEMLDELAAVAISEDWDEDPITRRYALPLPEGKAGGPQPSALPSRGAPGAAAASAASHGAARRASGLHPAETLPASWRAFR
jgi:hypothetical protein